MNGIRLGWLCKQFDVGKEELVNFILTQGIYVSFSSNFKVPECVLPAIQKKYGNKTSIENTEQTHVESIPQLELTSKSKPQIEHKSSPKQAIKKKNKRHTKKIFNKIDDLNTEKKKEDPPKSRLSILIEAQRGKKISGIIKCDRCYRKHSSGYLYTDVDGREYKVCAYCCKQKIDYSYVIYTPMGNKR